MLAINLSRIPNQAIQIRKADPVARRYMIYLFLGTIVLGGLLLLTIEHYRSDLVQWLLSEHHLVQQRIELLFFGFGALFAFPLFACAAYCWLLGTKTIREQEFPPSGTTVIRDTKLVFGHAAIKRGQALKFLGFGFVIALAGLLVLLWQVYKSFERNFS